nr:uncharacterized protein LOC108005266 [Drosophila suzukii]
MKFSNSMLICLYGLVICDWILAAPQPKCKLDQTINPSDYDPVDLTEDPIISAEVKALENQVELVNSLLLWPFQFLGNQIREQFEILRHNTAVLIDLERRNFKIQREKEGFESEMDDQEDEDQMESYEDKEPKPFRRPRNNKNITPFEPWNSPQSPVENLLPLKDYHFTVVEIHHFRLSNKTVIANY